MFWLRIKKKNQLHTLTLGLDYSSCHIKLPCSAASHLDLHCVSVDRLFCLFVCVDIIYIPVNNFQSCWDAFLG